MLACAGGLRSELEPDERSGVGSLDAPPGGEPIHDRDAEPRIAAGDVFRVEAGTLVADGDAEIVASAGHGDLDGMAGSASMADRVRDQLVEEQAWDVQLSVGPAAGLDDLREDPASVSRRVGRCLQHG
jgi:hypothetical protein